MIMNNFYQEEKKIKVLVTGANGQVGHSLVQQLSLLNNVELKAFGKNNLNITNQQEVNKEISLFNPDFVVNAAAYTSVDKAETEPELAYSVNELGPSYIAQATQAVNATLLHISTDYIFDGTKQAPYNESDSPNPKSVYGKSKLNGEVSVARHCSKYIILRTAWVFGECGSNFVKTMLKLGTTGSQISIIGNQFGGPTYAGDIATSIIGIIKQIHTSEIDLSGVYHYSGLPHVSWYQFATIIFEAAKKYNVLDNVPKVNEIPAEQYPLPAPRPSNSRLDCQQLEKVFAIVPSNWQRALKNINSYL